MTRDLRVVASRAIEASEARKRRRKKATPPRDMEWESARDAGRRRVKFPKRLLPAESHLLPRLEDSSRAERSSAEENRLGRSVRDRNSAARSRGNPDRRLAGDRPKPWKKFDGAGDSRGESRSDARGGDRKPYAAKSAGFKPRGAKPWAAKSGDGEFSPRPRAPREAGDRPKPWQRDRGEAGERPAGKKPYGKSSGFKPSGFTRSGFKSAGTRSAEARSADGESRAEGAKPWASKGASSRIGSAKSYKARSAGKPFAKAGGAKPWAKRSAASDGEGSAPKRRDRKETAGTGPREKSGAKPFWAKNPRGGKGSTAAGRSNRPQGKHAARKSGKKK